MPRNVCLPCESDRTRYLTRWRSNASQVLSSNGPASTAFAELVDDLRDARFTDDEVQGFLRPMARAHLERVVAFAWADGVIEDHEVAEFDRDAGAFNAWGDPHVDDMRMRLQRGLQLSQVRAGDLPRVSSTTLHLDADEFLHLEIEATLIRQLARGYKTEQGRLLASNKKLRFVGLGVGTELAWSKVLAVQPEYNNVVVSATTARGGGVYRTTDGEYVAAVLEGVLRVAKRLVLAPGQRDARSIPPNVKSEVWQRDGGKCVQCSAAEYLEFDHVIPLSRGGATSANNLQILCRRCNSEKGARM